MENEVRYPIGEQDFRNIRNGGYVYVDKTGYIRKLIAKGNKYIFLARPRRFGKSLLISTLKCFFEGERELFKGLEIDSMDWDWVSYPVLHLDFNQEKYAEPGKLEPTMDRILKKWEERYGVTDIAVGLPARFRNVIEAAHANTGRQVVILVDEYDKALVGNLHKRKTFEHYRERLASIYTNFKSAAEHIRLVFITGVSRFGRLSIFSDLNNLNDISFWSEYADICGITEKELYDNLKPGIRKYAEKLGVDFEYACHELKDNYDGYRFSLQGSDIYNPWSVFNALEKSDIRNYWNDTGIPTLLAESLKDLHVNLEKAFNSYCREDDLQGLDLLNPNPQALLYQTGYLTIKGYNPKIRKVRLGIPNKEVKEGLYRFLLPYYMRMRAETVRKTLDDITDSFILGNPEEAMEAMQTYFAGVDYKLKIENENNFQNAFFLLVDLLGLSSKAEYHTSDGSIDILLQTDDYIYIIELKYDHSAKGALSQIKEKKYARPFERDARQVILIGAAFSSGTRCIEGWKIEKVR